VTNREQHLLQALKEHLPNSPLWPLKEEWDALIKPYSEATRRLYSEVTLGILTFPALRSAQPADLLASWLFGNLLRKLAGEDLEGISLEKEKGTFLHRVGDKKAIIVKDNKHYSKQAFKLLSLLINTSPYYQEAKKQTQRMLELQPKLRELSDKINYELDATSLMKAFSDRCHLCPF